MAQWLLNRLFDTKDQPTPRFAFQGTVNWMKALSILVEDGSFADAAIKAHYSGVTRRAVNQEADTIVFENMLMAFHNHASLASLNNGAIHSYDVCRAAIISWYYSIYFTCSAMNAAASGSAQETHAHTAKVWSTDIVSKGLVLSPFSLQLDNLATKDVEKKIESFRGSNTFDLGTYASTSEEAWGGIISYLKGTAKYEKRRVEERVRGGKEFKALGVVNFRTKKAKELRDEQLSKNGVNFLDEAFRYRGKANYRDSIFLSYGYDETAKIVEFCEDLMKVSLAFQRMASAYLSRRVERDTWAMFIDDLEANSRLSIGVDHLRV